MDENTLFSNNLWQYYNKRLKGCFPVWDFGKVIVLVHLNIPQDKNQFRVDAEGDEVYFASLLFISRSLYDESVRYAVEFSLVFPSYDEVLKMTTLKKGEHELRIVGWEERSERWLVFDENRSSHLKLECYIYDLSVFEV